ncbi:MAG TPA: sigma-70 family RNA polymerase sigma factor [Cyclobacteriaceae bacterium]|nr:sigma-70 family RNA polymerase sigma factor [Cyclobacteriaceae bacterium]
MPDGDVRFCDPRSKTSGKYGLTLDIVHEKVESVYKTHFGKIVASLLYTFKSMELEHAEDIVQEAFSTAITDWKEKGIPTNTAGWLYTVCKNKALNEIKKRARVEPLNETVDIPTVESRFSESLLEDQQLKLLFACAHPDLSPKIQVVITLKYVINLKVEVIAKVLALGIDGVDKILVRARKKIETDKILLEVPSNDELKSRLPIVHKVIYLVFNEGYKSSGGNEIIREELCEEALLLARSLVNGVLCNSESLSLYSLMLFHAARLKARFSSNGKLLDLENQDRSLWQADLIALGKYYLERSESNPVSSFHIEACIAYTHCVAISFESTDWQLICQLYSKLLTGNANPFIELNYAIALYFSGEKEKAFDILKQLEKHPYMKNYFLLNATIGRFYVKQNKSDLAHQYLNKAIHQTNSALEKEFISTIIDEIAVKQKEH